MMLSLTVLIPLCGVALWAFFRFSPKDINKENLILIYNIIVIFVNILLCLIYSYRTYSIMINTVDRAWWPILSVLGSLFIFAIVLFVAAIIRFFIFRKAKGS